MLEYYESTKLKKWKKRQSSPFWDAPHTIFLQFVSETIWINLLNLNEYKCVYITCYMTFSKSRQSFFLRERLFIEFTKMECLAHLHWNWAMDRFDVHPGISTYFRWLCTSCRYMVLSFLVEVQRKYWAYKNFNLRGIHVQDYGCT